MSGVLSSCETTRRKSSRARTSCLARSKPSAFSSAALASVVTKRATCSSSAVKRLLTCVWLATRHAESRPCVRIGAQRADRHRANASPAQSSSGAGTMTGRPTAVARRSRLASGGESASGVADATSRTVQLSARSRRRPPSSTCAKIWSFDIKETMRRPMSSSRVKRLASARATGRSSSPISNSAPMAQSSCRASARSRSQVVQPRERPSRARERRARARSWRASWRSARAMHASRRRRARPGLPRIASRSAASWSAQGRLV